MAGTDGILSVLILVGIFIFALWLFFDVLGYSPSNTAGGAVAK